MNFIQYQKRPLNWDVIIKSYETKTLFHESCWHDHIKSIYKNSDVIYFVIKENDTIVGYFCCLMVKKYFIKIMGSPLGGTGTNYMGPLVNSDINQNDLISALENASKSLGVAHIEISNDFLSSNILVNNGYTKYLHVTHKIVLPASEDIAFNNFKSTCRNRIRKALKQNLDVEIMCNDSITEHFSRQFKEVYGKQGLTAPFGEERVKSLYDSLFKQNRLLPIMIRKNDDVIATGLFPFDENTIYFWGGTSWLRYQKYCPNELLHWTVIQFAIKNNIEEYNMCGGGSQFKNKFGGNDVSYIKYSKSNLVFLQQARNLYRRLHFLKLKLKGQIKMFIQ